MDSSLYNTMQKLAIEYKLDTNNIYYVGSITVPKPDLTTNKDVPTTQDVFLMIVGFKEHPIYSFVDTYGNLVAIDNGKGYGILPSKDYVDILSSSELAKMKNYEPINSDSLAYIDNQLSKISEKTGIPKDKILAFSETPQYLIENNKNSEKDTKIHLKDDDDKDTKSKQSQPQNTKKIEALEKQSTDLNQKVNTNQTLGDILGITQGGSLVAVYSDSIENGKTNNTKFTFLLKDKDGNYSEIPNIEQAGGIYPNTDVAQSNENGDTVTKGKVNSIYRVKGSSNIEYMLTANIGSHGTIELGIGQRDRTQGINEADLVTTSLKTTSNYYTTKETREALNSKNSGQRQATQRSQEANSHDENCTITKDEVDGDLQTGRIHMNSDMIKQISFRLMAHSDENKLIIENFNYSTLEQKITRLVNQDNFHVEGSMDDIEKTVRDKLNYELLNKERERTIGPNNQSA